MNLLPNVRKKLIIFPVQQTGIKFIDGKQGKQKIIMEQYYIYSMIGRKPNQYVIQNGKLVPKENTTYSQTSRVIPYSHTIRTNADNYHNSTLLQYQSEIQGLKKNYAQLQTAYCSLLSEQKGSPLRSSSVKEKFDQDNSTVLDCSSIKKSLVFDSFESSEKKTNLGSSTFINRSPLKKSFMYQSYIPQSNETENQKPEKQILNDEIKKIQLQFLQAKEKLQNSDKDMREFYETNMKKLQEILSRERKHTKLLNGVITRMRGEMESKDHILRHGMKTGFSDKASLEKMVKRTKLKL